MKMKIYSLAKKFNAMEYRYLMRKRHQAAAPWVRGKVLDIGCGTGFAVSCYGLPPEQYVGVDYNPVAVEKLRQTLPGYRFYCLDIDRRPLTPLYHELFDTVLMLAVIEHLDNPGLVLHECGRLLAEGGYLVLSTPSRLGNILLNFYWSKVMGFQSSFHKDSFGYRELCGVSGHSLKIETYKRFECGLNQLFICRREV
ncbi:MAG: class I SAM-dependent methyltransferase [Peptococcaceae bacterium]|nr:MAG: class I SAM-dependent methyltransferase [Peptococcaceae bacterium]